MGSRKESKVPGDPKECRSNAKRCFELAKEVNNPVLQDSFCAIAHQWMRLASDLEATHRLLKDWGHVGVGDTVRYRTDIPRN
jgi:hypothetical protein